MNEVLEIIKRRSSIRAYTGEKLTEGEIRSIVMAGLRAPTARNEREIHISVVDGSNPLLKELDRENKLAMLKNTADSDARAKIDANPNNFYYDAPTVFILSADRDFYWSKLDAGIAVENMSIAAQSMGLGNLIIGVISAAMTGEKKDYFAKAFKFPENYEFAIAFASGHRNTVKEPHETDFEKSVSFI